MSNRRRGGAAGVQPPRRRRTYRAWSKLRRGRFLKTLAESCNVSEAARAAGMDRSSAYDLKDRDPEFQRGWSNALARGYGELEWRMLERAQQGSVRTEITCDPRTGEIMTVKLTHEHRHAVGLRLLLAHKIEVAAFQAAEAAIADLPTVEQEWAWLKKIDARLEKAERAETAAALTDR